MNIKEIFLLSLGVSMDALAVSISIGCYKNKSIIVSAILYGLIFGLFQFIMPMIGFLLGNSLLTYLYYFKDIISFVIFGVIGLIMIIDSLKNGVENNFNINFYELFLLAIATSLDAMFIGITFNFSNISFYILSLCFFLVTFVASCTGTIISYYLGFNKYSIFRFVGGLLLLFLGVSFLI